MRAPRPTVTLRVLMFKRHEGASLDIRPAPIEGPREHTLVVVVVDWGRRDTSGRSRHSESIAEMSGVEFGAAQVGPAASSVGNPADWCACLRIGGRLFILPPPDFATQLPRPSIQAGNS